MTQLGYGGLMALAGDPRAFGEEADGRGEGEGQQGGAAGGRAQQQQQEQEQGGNREANCAVRVAAVLGAKVLLGYVGVGAAVRTWATSSRIRELLARTFMQGTGVCKRTSVARVACKLVHLCYSCVPVSGRPGCCAREPPIVICHTSTAHR